MNTDGSRTEHVGRPGYGAAMGMGRAVAHAAARRLLPGTRRRAVRPADRGAALALLEVPGCPVCRSVDRAVARWLVTYENESRTDLGMRERLRAALGFCPPHTRALLDQSGASASWLARWLFADVADAAVGVLRAAASGTGGSAWAGPATTTGAGASASAGCPLCGVAADAARDALGTLVRGLTVDEVAENLRSGDGPCVTHAATLVAEASASHLPSAAATVAEVVGDRLGKDHLTAYSVLVGSDPDVSRRRRLAARLEPETGGAERFPADHCPVCVSAVRTEQRYLRWLAEAGDADAKERTLCRRHLADLGEVESVVVHLAALWGRRFQDFLDHGGAAGSSRQARLAAERLSRAWDCRACDLRDAAVERTWRGLRLAAADPAQLDRIAQAHGVCLRHGLSVELPGPWRDVLAARVAWLAHDLSEAERKSTRAARWEEPGPEASAWQRAAALLTGA